MVLPEVVSPDSVGMSPERIGWARDMVHRHVETGRSPSAVAVVARHGQVVLAEAVGVQRPDGEQLRPDHVWPIASASKPLTAAVVMSLVEQGSIGIAQSMVDYLPELRGTGNDEVLIHHLLTHTAGWESALRTQRVGKMMESGEFPAAPPGRNSIDHVFLTLAFDPVKVAEPGEQMDYDNSHYTLLDEIVRRLTGGTFDAAMRSRLLDPLGMRNSALIVGEALKPKLVKRAAGLPFGPDDLTSFEGEIWEQSDNGAVGLHMSALDLLTFGQMILDGGVGNGERVLSRGSVRAMATNQVPGVPAMFGAKLIPEASWGYGFTVLSEWPFAYFSGGLVPVGSAMHPGAGGIGFWVDFRHEIVGVFFEVITEVSEFLEPISGIGHRFQDVIIGSVLE